MTIHNEEAHCGLSERKEAKGALSGAKILLFWAVRPVLQVAEPSQLGKGDEDTLCMKELTFPWKTGNGEFMSSATRCLSTLYLSMSLCSFCPRLFRIFLCMPTTHIHKNTYIFCLRFTQSVWLPIKPVQLQRNADMGLYLHTGSVIFLTIYTHRHNSLFH